MWIDEEDIYQLASRDGLHLEIAIDDPKDRVWERPRDRRDRYVYSSKRATSFEETKDSKPPLSESGDEKMSVSPPHLNVNIWTSCYNVWITLSLTFEPHTARLGCKIASSQFEKLQI